MPVLWADCVITREIIRNYTARVIVHRMLRENARKMEMALEFKGIKANSLRLMANHDKLNKTLAGAVESSDKLISHVGDFKGMSDRMVEDIEFAANVLGNGSGDGSSESGKGKEELKPPPAIPPAPKPENESATALIDSMTVSREEVGSAAASNFHEL